MTTKNAESTEKPEPLRKLHFACGATYEVKGEPSRTRAGKLARLMVFAMGEHIAPPLWSNGHKATCFFGCPTTGKHRKEGKAWVGKNAKEAKGEPVHYVTCQPTHILPNDKAER
jgi:hypothetical protein